MKKVLIISKLPPPVYGTTIWTQILLNSGLNDYFTIVHFNNNIHYSFDTLGKPKLSTVLQNFILYLKLLVVIYRERPDLVFIPVSQTTMGFIKDSIFVIISRIFRRKVLLILHGSNFRNWLDNSSNLVRKYAGFVIKSTRGIVVLGDKLKDLFKGIYSEDRIFVVPNGGNFLFPVKAPSEITRILYLGNLLPSKGILYVINSLLLLGKYNERIVLNIAGTWFDKKFEDLCIKIVAENNLPVKFHGHVTGYEKYKLLANSDIFVFPPVEPEGHPYVIIEAMAAGLPIISTNKGAISESVIDGKSGFIVEAENAKEISEKIRFLIENPEIRNSMSQESIGYYKKRFTEEKLVEKLVSVFNHVIDIE